MTYRTDVEFRGGKLAVRQDASADARKDLPEVKLSDRLMSLKWSEGITKELEPYGYDTDSSLTSALNVQREMAASAQRLMSKRSKQHPSDTQYEHLRKLSNDYDKVLQNHAASNDRARKTVKGRLSQVDNEFRDSVGYNTKDAQEIRAVLRGMKPAERSEAISEAIANGDGNVLGAILDANPIATGITKEQQQNYRAHAMNTHRPDLLALKRSLSKVDDLIFDSFNDLLSASDDITAKQVREQYEKLAQEAEAQNAPQPQWG
ncbi:MULTISPECIES: hypothetical protein [Idiomarina]|jgi:ElaB/YqjD/DUF883 family membrane-anchored ribosome-binding protein|uniref:hypothetical protein n=1 Tax=Idiomarina TaxID=135575 RepID=UPI000C0A229A|nr:MULTISPECIES: hypothetical protein [Idiomarina]MAC32093.1 hypothetical protein [Haliea sp.]MAO68152.1 hypothetical protein [Idiomarina sp.]MBF79904.1 hypothetical protein [Idiomarina sp.]|tara:strand:+ start:7919 stop:8704 length:786 start_codon:yes stop_codon:yes gene_type:complete